jgi:hypothetical protein
MVGDYRLSIELDEKCAQILRVRTRTYEVGLEDQEQLLFMRIIDGEFGYLGGALWPPGSDAGYRFRWNDSRGDCDYPVLTGNAPLYLCGEGSLAPEASTLSGVILREAWLGDAPAGRRCLAASHKVAFVRQP